jgi:hypothetical protein
MKKKQNPLIIEEITAQREIAEIQLERLKNISRERLLSYEETKIMDLLHKNLLLAKGDATTITATSRHISSNEALTEEALVQIASSIDESLVNRSLEIVDKETETEDDKAKS